uniref:Guanine nucleotide binding protein (G protein), beta polypeptide 1-like n=1 Tax=Lepisosteus oculatus TaxID=7918 RepID=W5M341_LEPOC
EMAVPPPDPLFVLRGSGTPVNTLHFSCRDAVTPLLFSGSAKGTIHIWNLTTHRAERTLDGHGGASVLWLSTLRSADALISVVQCVDFRGSPLLVHRDSTRESCHGQFTLLTRLLITAVDYQCPAAPCCWSFAGHTRSGVLYATQEQISPNENEMMIKALYSMTPCRGLKVRIIELPSKMPVCSLKPEAKLGMPMCLKLWQPDSGCSPQLLVGYEDGTIALWDLSQRKQLSHLAAYSQPVMCLDFDQGKLRGVSGSSETVIKSWSLDGQQRLQLQDSVEVVNPGISQLCIREDRKILASAGWDHRIRVFGWKKLKPLAVLQYHMDSVHCVSFSDHREPSQRLMAAGSKDRRISVWSIYTSN